MRKIRIAQIGTSRYGHGNSIFDCLKKHPELFEIAGYHFPEGEREKFPRQAQAFEGYPELSLEELLEDPTIEAVTVETEEIYLTGYAALAAAHGKHVHMEKPGSPSLRAFEQLMESAKNSQKVFHIGYMYRYNRCIQELKDEIRRGELGEILSVEAQMNCYHPKELRDWLALFPGGMMFYLGCHLVDLILSLQGEPLRVLPLNKRSGLDGAAGEDFGMAVFEYEKGISFAKTIALERGGFERRQLVVTGSKKTVELRPLEWYVGGGELITERYDRQATDWHAATEKEVSAPQDRYYPMMEAFAAMVRGERTNPYTPEYELTLFRLLTEACQEEKR